MAHIKYRRRGRPPLALSPQVTPLKRNASTFSLLRWLKDKRILNEQEIELIDKFRSLYQKVMLTYGVNTLKSSLPPYDVPLKTSHWELSTRDEKKWRNLLKTMDSFPPQAWQTLRLLAQDPPLSRDFIVVSQHLNAAKRLLYDLHAIL